jgi:invasion protein IalB
MVMLRNLIKLAALAAVPFMSSAANSEQEASQWATNCFSLGRSTLPQCSMSHTVAIKETGQVLFNVTVRIPIEPGLSPYLDIVGPLGFYLPNGLEITIADQPFVTLSINRCDANGCYAGTILTDEQLGQLKQGGALSVAFSPKPEQNTQVEIPLASFTEAYDRIDH